MKILENMGLPSNKLDITSWKEFVSNIRNADKKVTIGIVGKYFSTGDYQLRDSYAALFDALDHAGWFLKSKIETKWVSAEKINDENAGEFLKGLDGVIVPIGWGTRGVEGMISAIKYTRVNKIPYLGLCYGMQLAVVEFARHVADLNGANSSEVDAETEYPVIHTISGQEENIKRRAYGGTMRLGRWDCRIFPKTLSFDAYKKDVVAERHRHRYEFNDEYAKLLTDKGLVIAGRSVVENLVEIIELPKSVHPFFLATQFHPEYKSRPLQPHPLFIKFIEAALK